jgi:hypothetical protein
MFNPRVNLIVPNVSWGLNLHECDLLVVTKSGYAYEVEIKISRADLKADMRKRHGHHSKLIRRLYFSIPRTLLHCIEFVPARAGIISVGDPEVWLSKNDDDYFSCNIEREAEILPGAPPLSESERFQVARLGTMRIWSLKKKIVRLKNKVAAITSPNTPMPSEAPQIAADIAEVELKAATSA